MLKRKAMRGRVFGECEVCDTSIYKIKMNKTGKAMTVNAQKITLEQARELYGNVYFLIDDDGNTFIKPLNRVGFLPHWVTCSNRSIT